MEITKEALLNLMMWVKYTANGDEDIYDIADILELFPEITRKEVIDATTTVEAGNAREYIKTLSKPDEYDATSNN
jgi:hypothetical protein